MKARGKGGKIINIGSLMSVRGMPYLADLRHQQGRAGATDDSASRRMGRAQYPGELYRSRIHFDRAQPRDVADEEMAAG